MPAIRTHGLTKYYGDVVALENVTLEVAEGEVFGFLGPNGAGKTTTIRMLLDLVRPSAGDAFIGSFNCRTHAVEARRLVGYLPGDLPIYPELTGRAFLEYLASVGQRAIDPAYLAHLIRRFDVSDVDLRRPMRDYSHGMKRKLGIIQALAPSPPVLILDEPTNGLDPLMIEAFAETIGELKTARRTTVFLSSHVLGEVDKTCDRVALIRRGQLAAVRSVAEIRATMPRRLTVTFTVPVSTTAATATMWHQATLVAQSPRAWVLDVRGPLGPVISALAGLSVDDVQVEPFTLEDYVLQFYSGAPS